jgi:hypothetical protein
MGKRGPFDKEFKIEAVRLAIGARSTPSLKSNDGPVWHHRFPREIISRWKS